MSFERIQVDFANAAQQFPIVELRRRADASLFVKAALQTSAGNLYTASIDLQEYPSRMPGVSIDRPPLDYLTPHRYRDGRICYLHPKMWNPGRHDISFVISRIAKWLNKYDVWRHKGEWPGEEILH